MNTFLRFASYLLIHLIKTPSLVIRKSKVSYLSKIKLTTIIIRSKVGKYCYIGGEAYLINTIIGNYCSIATGVKIGGMEHSWWWASTSPYLSDCNVTDKVTIIEDDVWIGVNSVIRQGIKIGRGAVIGAGSVVLKDIPPYAIFVGAPARCTRMRFNEKIISQLIQTEYWNCNPKQAKAKLIKLDLPTSPQDIIKKA